RINYALRETPLVSILIPNHDHAEDLHTLITSIRERSTYANYEILIVENHSKDNATFELYNSLRETDQRIRIIEWDQPFNYSSVNNYAAESTSAEVLLFLNNDIEVTDPEWLEELVSQTMRPEIGAVGARLLYPDHTVQHAGVVLGVGGIAVEAFKFLSEWDIGHMGRAHLPQWYSAVTGACLATRKEVFVKAGGFNTDALAVAYNDVDYCLRLKRDLGLHTLWTPYARLIHHESVSRGYDITPEKKQRIDRESRYMLDTWGAVIENDPYYNPNLTRNETNFFLAWPPRVDKPWKKGAPA
ncbi:MAG TPA: glycosyltransferase family 2 protein, partial [Opitutales bacterium]|nr:glycosyltransferase family 2 protein [Opitutales bacterium]